MDRLPAGTLLVQAGGGSDHHTGPNGNVIYDDGNMTTMRWLSQENPSGAILFEYATLAFKKLNIFILAMSHFLYTTATLSLEVPTAAVTPAFPVAIPSLSVPNNWWVN